MADTKISALTNASTLTGVEEMAGVQSAASVAVSVDQIGDYLFKRINSNSGAAGNFKTLQKLNVDATANATTTLATVMTTTGVGTGVWHFKYNIIYQAAATTTGVDFAVNHTGTSFKFVLTTAFATSGGAAANGLADQTGSATASMMEAKAQRGENTKVGSTLGVDTINSDMHYIIEGIISVNNTGSLELRHCSEVAASSQVMSETCLELTKIG